MKTIVGAVQTGIKIKELHFARNILTFLRKFHQNDIDDDAMAEFQIKMQDDLKYRQRVVEHVTLYCDRFTQSKKAEILANLFIAHLNNRFDWREFSCLTDCLDIFNMAALDGFHELAAPDNEGRPFGVHQVRHDAVPFLMAAGIGRVFGNNFSVTRRGKMLYHHGILGNVREEFVE